MRKENVPARWNFASPARGTEAKFRRWNIVLIVVLGFLVLGVFVAAKAPEQGSAPEGTKVTAGTSQTPNFTSAQPVEPSGAQH